MSFSEVESLGHNIGSPINLGSGALSHAAPSVGQQGAGGLGLDTPGLGQKLPCLSYTSTNLGQSPLSSGHCPAGLGPSTLGTAQTDAGGEVDQCKPNATSSTSSISSSSTSSSTTTLSSSSSSSSTGSAAFAGFQVTPPLASPTVNFTPVSRPNFASMRGIGGFTSPALSPPPVVTSNSIASTLGNPQMPSITFFNSRAPMGFNFRMAGSNLSGVPIVYKRKPDEELEEVKPMAKQHISEERMAAHLNSLHLSESYCNHRLGKRGWSERKVSAEDMDDNLGEDEQRPPSTEGPSRDTMRLIIADEVKQIVPGESQLPPQLFKKLTQPRMEVVLWQPPGDVIRNIITSNSSQQIAKSSLSDDASESAPVSSSEPPASSSSTSQREASNSSSPDSGVSVTSPPPSLTFSGQDVAGASSSYSSSTSSDMDALLSLPSTSSGSRGGYLPPLRRPTSPLPDPMVDDDFSERMEFNNNNDSAPNYMWLEENNNTALIDLNAIEPHRTPQLEDLPDLPDSDDMDL